MLETPAMQEPITTATPIPDLSSVRRNLQEEMLEERKKSVLETLRKEVETKTASIQSQKSCSNADEATTATSPAPIIKQLKSLSRMKRAAGAEFQAEGTSSKRKSNVDFPPEGNKGKLF